MHYLAGSHVYQYFYFIPFKINSGFLHSHDACVHVCVCLVLYCLISKYVEIFIYLTVLIYNFSNLVRNTLYDYNSIKY